MTSMREEIRNVMLANGSPMRPCEVGRALPQYDPRRILEAIVGGMFREDIVYRVVRDDGFVGYFPSRTVKRKKYETEEERREGKRRTDAAHHLRNCERKKAERAALRPFKLAALAEKRRALSESRAAAREAAKQARKAERDEQREAQRALWARRKAEQRAKKRLTQQQRIFAQPAAPRVRQITEAAPVKIQYESVAEFLAKGGQIEVLPPGAVSEPLKHITGHGFRNTVSFRETSIAA